MMLRDLRMQETESIREELTMLEQQKAEITQQLEALDETFEKEKITIDGEKASTKKNRKKKERKKQKKKRQR